MKKKILIIALLSVICIKSYSQIIFEKGYFIDDSNQQTECLIRNVDWKNNPTEFEYKIAQDAVVKKGGIKTIKEFGIYGTSKYIRAFVKIDRSGDDVTNLSSKRNPVLQEEELFLKVLVEGKATLFLYVDGNLVRFFYKLNDSEVEQLIYKSYLIDNRIAENNYFKQQLLLNLKCPAIALKDIEHLAYVKRDLERFFIKYNECSSSGYINYELKQKKDLFNLSIRPGLNYSSLKIYNSLSDFRDTDFGSNVGFRFGVEAEFILPVNKNKWGLVIEPTYQYFKSETSKETNSVFGGILVSKISYKSLELPIGLRHYLYLNSDSKIFANVFYVFDFLKNRSTIEFARKDGQKLNKLEVQPKICMALGVGYKYKDRYSFEMRYHIKHDILGDYQYWNSNYSTLNLILGYSLF